MYQKGAEKIHFLKIIITSLSACSRVESPTTLENTQPDIVFIMADDYPDMVRKIDVMMHNAVTPSDRYPVGEVYEGGPI